ncbi:hypothetical protein A9Q94_15255 [Rhodobacterales bacterium 56_14_T64]|nr:hypothetical protein A9Q94_15255 [Rhodobacterales bacterium 56_14_T64]
MIFHVIEKQQKALDALCHLANGRAALLRNSQSLGEMLRQAPLLAIWSELRVFAPTTTDFAASQHKMQAGA